MNILVADDINDYDDKGRVYEIVVMGGMGVGKSCFTFRFVHGRFVEKFFVVEHK